MKGIRKLLLGFLLVTLFGVGFRVEAKASVTLRLNQTNGSGIAGNIYWDNKTDFPKVAVSAENGTTEKNKYTCTLSNPGTSDEIIKSVDVYLTTTKREEGIKYSVSVGNENNTVVPESSFEAIASSTPSPIISCDSTEVASRFGNSKNTVESNGVQSLEFKISASGGTSAPEAKSVILKRGKVTAVAKDTKGNPLAADIQGSGTYLFPGETVTLTAPASLNGYTFKQWMKGDTFVGQENNNSYTVTKSGEAAEEFIAVYKEPPKAKYSVKTELSHAGAGEVTVFPENATGTGVEEGSTVYFTAYANNGFTFKNWSAKSGNTVIPVNNANQKTDASIVMPAGDVVITANFEKESGKTVEVTVMPGKNGDGAEVTANGKTSGNKITFTMDINSSVTIKASDTNGQYCSFVKWVVSSGGSVDNAKKKSTTLRVDGTTDKVTVKADYDSYEEAQPHKVTIKANPSDGGLVSVNSLSGGKSENKSKVSTTAVKGETVAIACGPAYGYTFKKWKVTSPSSGLTISSSKSKTAEFEMPDEDVVVEAVFEGGTEKTYKVKLSAEGSGGASADPESGTTGTTVKISAKAGSGYTFKEWKVVSGGVTLANAKKASTTFKIGTKNVEVKAVFVKNGSDDPSTKISIKNAKITLSAKSFTYNGKVRKPKIRTIGGYKLTENTDYTVKWENSSSKKVGTYKLTITGIGDFKGSTSTTYEIKKAANTLKVKLVKDQIKVSYSKLKKNAQSIKCSTYLNVSKAKGDVTYEKKKGNSKITVDKNTGKLKIAKKGLKKGTYPVTLRVTAAGTKNYKKTTKTVTFNIVVK